MMGANLILALINVTATSSVAILLVGLLRKPLRVAAGARAAYWLWLLVSVSTLAALLPAPSQTLWVASNLLQSDMNTALSSTVVTITRSRTAASFVVAVLMIWAAGSGVMFTLLLSRQRLFVRSLGELRSDSEGVQRSDAIVAPMLVGVWRPRVIVPADFETRYTAEEQQLVLAHERAHRVRHDVSINAFATVWLCLFWFNPLIYWAMGRLRLDQELACDAFVLARSGAARRCYADALLKTQLATESAWRVPAGCHWQSNHPLKERIVMLKRPLPGLSRRLIGITFVLALTISSGYAAWAAQSEAHSKGTPIVVQMKWSVSTVSTSPLTKTAVTNTFRLSTPDTLIYTGGVFAIGTTPGHPYAFRCSAFRPDDGKQTPAWDDMKAHDISLDQQILFECNISYDGKVVATPSVATLVDKLAMMEADDLQHRAHYKLELTASMSKERIAAAKRALAIK